MTYKVPLSLTLAGFQMSRHKPGGSDSRCAPASAPCHEPGGGGGAGGRRQGLGGSSPTASHLLSVADIQATREMLMQVMQRLLDDQCVCKADTGWLALSPSLACTTVALEPSKGGPLLPLAVQSRGKTLPHF